MKIKFFKNQHINFLFIETLFKFSQMIKTEMNEFKGKIFDIKLPGTWLKWKQAIPLIRAYPN